MNEHAADQQAIIDHIRKQRFTVREDPSRGGWLVQGSMEGTNELCSWIARLDNVTAVELGPTDMADDGFATLCGIKTLKRLYCDGSRYLTSEGFKAVKGLRHMQDLDMGVGDYGDAAATSIATLTELRRLRLANCCLTPEGLKDIGRCSQLEYLDISHNPISHGFSALKKCMALKELFATDCPIDVEGAQEIGTLNGLERLHIPACPIDDEKMQHIVGCGKLRDLRISRCPLTGASLDYLPRLPRLEEVWWPANAFDSQKLDVFTRLPKLRKLVFCSDITDEEPVIPEENLIALAKMLPDCEVLQY